MGLTANQRVQFRPPDHTAVCGRRFARRLSIPGSGASRQVRVPQQSCRHGAPGTPTHCERRGFVARRHCAQSAHFRHRFVQAKIAGWPHVGTSQRHQQVHAGSPGPDTWNSYQCRAGIRIRHAGDALERYRAALQLRCQPDDVACFLPGEPQRQQRGFAGLQHPRRSHLAPEVQVQPGIERRGRCQ